ncbi:MAG: hypothetical protein GWP19_07850 [Planctomycetia bacterium]|nr:hypothetical protein [Planctomycetia bacterium]
MIKDTETVRILKSTMDKLRKQNAGRIKLWVLITEIVDKWLKEKDNAK